MSVSDQFRDYALEQLGRHAPALRFKRMFGGGGLYSADRIFAVIDDDQVYLKADDQTRSAFLAAGWPPFAPMGEGGGTMSYYALPGDVLEDADALAPWVQLALETSRRSKAPKPRRPR